MTYFEIVSLLIPWLALVISLVTLFQQRKLQREANELQRATSELARRQLLSLQQDEHDRTRVKLRLSITKDQLFICNVGRAEALNLEIESLGQKEEDILLNQSFVRTQFPLPKLGPSEETKLPVQIYMNSPAKFLLRLRWRDPDGTKREEDYTVSL